MTEQKQQRIFLLVFSISIIILVNNVAGKNVNGADNSPASETRISEPELFQSNGTKSASSSKNGDKNPQLFSQETVQASIIAEEDETEDESPPVEDADEEEAGAEEEYEGEEEGDEYAEELRAAAESHEAMSRHDKQSTNQTNPSEVDHGSNNPSKNSELHRTMDATKKDFDSREKSVESGSDEDESSNETVVEGAEGEDEEVTELLKYKTTNHFKTRDDKRYESVKKKRMPTVKKELSTQTEIKIANVSTKQEKRFSTKEMLHELNEQFKHSIGYTEKPCDDKKTPIANEPSDKIEEVFEETEVNDYLDRNSATSSDKRSDSKLGDLDSDEIEEPRKLDKRQKAVLRDLESYLRAEYAAEQEQQQKLQELGAQEGALAESLLELLVKLAENPRRWERVHRLLMDVEGGLELSRQALEARKRAFNLTSVVTTTTATSPVSTTPKKPRKKPKKKKKKKQRHHRFSTTTTTIPTTIPLLTTTEAPWLTTPMQWRLVAERLFGPPWPQDLQDDPGVAKVRFTVPSNSRTSTPSREFVEQLGDSKQLQDHKALNTERQALMLESSREYTQPRHLHYGKVNTHQGISSHREQSTPSKYHGGNRDNSRVRDYDPPERTSVDYDMTRYGQYDYPGTRIQGEEYFPVQSYAQNHEYRPPGREYAASKSWHDTQYKYGRPSWKSDDRSGVDSSEKWTWPQIEEEPKSGWHRSVQNEREFWPRVSEHENDQAKVWPLQTQRSADGWGRISGTDSWTRSASWPNEESPKSQYERDQGSSPPWETTKSRTESSTNLGRVGQKLKDGTKMPIKSWTGLTSDDETWPFKLTDTKPWQKNVEEKSYSQNSAMVRKLGLQEKDGKDNFEKNLQKDLKNNNNSKYKSNNKPKNDAQKNPGLDLEDQMHRMNPWSTEMNTSPKIWPPKTAISPKIQSVGAWVMPVDQSTWKPYKLKGVDSYQGNNEGDTNRHRWNVEMDTNPRTWPPKMGDDQWNKFAKPASSVTWPKWKQFAYHRVTAMPILSQGASLQDGSRARNNAYIAVSAVSPRYNGNQWRKNDIEETPVGQTASGSPPGLIMDPEHPVSQLRGSLESAPIYTWKKDGSSKAGKSGNQNSTDPLEEQLETLRRGTSWSHNENRDNIKKQLNVINDASENLASRFSSNSSINKPEDIKIKEFSVKSTFTNGEKIDQEKKKVTHK